MKKNHKCNLKNLRAKLTALFKKTNRRKLSRTVNVTNNNKKRPPNNNSHSGTYKNT